MTEERDPWQLDEMGCGACPLCATVVRGEHGTFINYWHPVEVCRDALVIRVRDLERRLSDAERILEDRRIVIPRYEGS